MAGTCLCCVEEVAVRPFPTFRFDETQRPDKALCAKCWRTIATVKLDDTLDEFKHIIVQLTETVAEADDVEGADLLAKRLVLFSKKFEKIFDELEGRFSTKEMANAG